VCVCVFVCVCVCVCVCVLWCGLMSSDTRWAAVSDVSPFHSLVRRRSLTRLARPTRHVSDVRHISVGERRPLVSDWGESVLAR
jgi:hypothetical protein